ncbi:MAG: hypothetical protein QM802_10960 [Agriterribacter sp.]
MRRNLPYEKLIADKMKDLPVPDRETAWQQMKTLLDTEMPVGMKGTKGTGGKWWWMSGLAIIVTIGTGLFFYLTTKKASTEALSQHAAEEQTNDIPSSHQSIPTIDQKSTSSKTTVPYNPEEKTSASNIAPTANTDKHISGEVNDQSIVKENNSITEKKITVENRLTNTDEAGRTNKSQSAEEKRIPLKNQTVAAPHGERPSLNTYRKNNKKNYPPLSGPFLTGSNGGRDRHVTRKDDLQKFSSQQKNPQGNTSAHQTPDVHININAGDMEEVVFDEGDETFTQTGSLQSVNDERSLIVDANENEPGNIEVPANVWTLPDVKAKRKTILREMKRKERKEERELAKSYQSSPSFWGAKTDRWFAAGIAPYQNFAIASQQAYNYNSGGGRGVASDYIPAAYLQLHVTNRIYLMSEFQFNSPQATPNLLISEKNINTPMNVAGCMEDVYLRKLYYFNLPVSFYYSPVKNFYLGSGIQFSSLNSGLAYIEQRTLNNTLINSQTVKIKDDQLSSKIRGSEWRYLFDANYYYDRFMFGFRYNQALNNYVSLRTSNNVPLTQARNQAFQFYIRYNIIVSNKKR